MKTRRPSDEFVSRASAKEPIRVAPRYRSRPITGVVGLDLSLRSTAACWIPKDWTGDTKALRTLRDVGEDLPKDAPPRELARRRSEIANAVQAFVLDFVTSTEMVAVYVEDYAFDQHSSSASGLRELGGVVKDRLFALGFDPTPVTASTARKTLLGKLPREGSKEYTHDNVRRLKGEALYWNGDEIDAFVVANHGARLEGFVPISFEGKAT